MAQPSQLSAHARLLQLVPVSGGSPPPLLSTVLQQAVAERLRGREALCEPFAFELDLLATNAHWDLGPLLGQPLGLQLTLADGAPRRWYGLCTAAGRLGSDGGLARYQLQLHPFTALL